MMQTGIPFDLIAKYLANECSEEEKKRLYNWKNANAENNETFELMKKTWTGVPDPEYTPNVEKALESVTSRLPEQKKKQSLWSSGWIKIAAIFVLGTGVFGIYKFLWTGAEMIEVTSAPGTKPKEIILPDNSKIILSQNSELRYPSEFKKNIRSIEFSGEAYFDIAPDKTRPFVIESELTTTRVTGTEFNLRTYKEDSIIKITVTEGSVSFKAKNNNALVMVGVGEAGTLHVKTNVLTKEQNDDRNFMAWRDGKLSFENETLGSALKTLSRYYNKTFITSTKLDTVIFNGYFDSMDIQGASEYIEMILDVNIVEENNQFVLRPNN